MQEENGRSHTVEEEERRFVAVAVAILPRVTTHTTRPALGPADANRAATGRKPAYSLNRSLKPPLLMNARNRGDDLASLGRQLTASGRVAAAARAAASAPRSARRW
jgi:hypothetical protein